MATALSPTMTLRAFENGAGLVLVPIDRATIALVWSDHGYPASGAYRDYYEQMYGERLRAARAER